MPPRPLLKVKQNRPVSAIYLGKGANSNVLQSAPSSSSHTEGTPPGLPDLPEPPSPNSSIGSVQSGLPSPPATNSTGSGSTGDPASIAIRERPLSHHSNSSNSTSSGTVSTPMKRSINGSETGVEDDDYDNENDSNDDTARLNENVMALQRVKSLTERNRMALHKLSRISSPSPHRPSPPRSGSETEREQSSSSSLHHPSPSLSSVNLSHDSPEYHRPRLTSAPTSASVSSSNSSHSRRRKRASMASMSTLQLTDFEEEEYNDGMETATGTARDRTRDRTLSERDLITQSALAAVASSRRSPLSSRRRAALPKEFRSDLVDDSPTPAGPSTGRRSAAGKYDTQRASIDADIKRESWKQPAEPVTPFRSNRPSTVRDYRRSGGPNPRWSVNDFRSPSTIRDRQYNTSHSNEDGSTKRERRQTMRGGSAESALVSPGGRSLIGEGLRAAGLSKRREEERTERRVDWSPEDEQRNVILERERPHPPRAATSMAHYRYLDKEDDLDSRYRDTDGPGRQLPSRDREISLARAEASLTKRERERDSIPMDRAGSSFSRYNHNSHTHTSSPVSLLATPHHMHERISTSSPFSTRRLNSQTPGAGSSTNQTEHIKLMLESLTMFETQLNRLPLGKSVGSSSTGTGASQTELAKNAQSMVYAAERLSGLLKQGNGRAVEEQVEAEVEGSSSSSSSTGRDIQEIGNIWGRVAAEYRENSRVADELVRGMTGFLLGIGRVMRDIGPSLSSSSMADYAGGSPSVHGKHASLDATDEEGMRLRREGVSPDLGSAGSGRRSASSRNSWEPRERDRIAGAGASSGSGASGAGGQRPESVLARASPATYQKLRPGDRDLQYETPPQQSQQHQHFRQGSIRKPLPTPGDRIEAARKLFTPREQREQLLDAKFSSDRPVSGSGMPTRDSQETLQPLHQLPQSNEPSPTPASRTRVGVLNTQERERTRILTPLNIPKPLPTLPSETLARRQSTNNNVERTHVPTPASTTTPAPTSTTMTTSRDRRATIRSSLPAFPSLTTPSNATTALTPHTVSNSSSHPNGQISAHTNPSGFPLLRTDSGRSDRSQVTFSRPLGSASVSVSAALTGLQMQFKSGESSAGAGAGDRDRDRDRGKERERVSERVSEEKRRTVGNLRSARMSLDGLVEQMTHDEDRRGGSSGATAGASASGTSGGGGGGGGGSRRMFWDTHAADRSAASTFLQHPGPANRRERRRTVTDIWPQ